MLSLEQTVAQNSELIFTLTDCQLDLLKAQVTELQPLSSDLSKEELFDRAERAMKLARDLCQRLQENCALTKNLATDMRVALEEARKQKQGLRDRLTDAGTAV